MSAIECGSGFIRDLFRDPSTAGVTSHRPAGAASAATGQACRSHGGGRSPL